jgi:Spy/CpxP family protein refolding chaperone
LPNGWPKLGLDSKQVAKIYSVQEKFHTEIEELEHRLEELKTKQGEEMLAVLTAEQQAALKAQKEKPKATATKPSTEE